VTQPAESRSPRRIPPPTTPEFDTGPLKGLALRAILSVVLLIALAGAFFLGRSRSFEPRTPSHVELRPSVSVIMAVRDLARLESAAYHIEKVIELTDGQTKLFGLVEAKDAILLVAVGEVTAGVDLEKVTAEDIQVDNLHKKVRLVLPAPEVFSVALDNDKTHVHQRTTDTLATRNEQLEAMARREAEAAMRKAATDGGVLTRARANAERTLRALLVSLGFEQIEIEWKGGA
jgi:hypothetical protein